LCKHCVCVCVCVREREREREQIAERFNVKCGGILVAAGA